MTSLARRRLLIDCKRLQQDPICGICAMPTEHILCWKAVIFGTPDTSFEDGTFKLEINFTEEYPSRPPKVRFVTKMFHPNIYKNGNICIDILDKHWSSAYDVAGILTSIQSLLNDPNPDSPANVEAARLYETDRRAYERQVSSHAEKSLIHS